MKRNIFIHSRYAVKLTVNIHIATDVGAAQGIGDLTGYWFSEEGMINQHLISVSRRIRDHVSPLRPSNYPPETQTEQEMNNPDGRCQGFFPNLLERSKAVRKVFFHRQMTEIMSYLHRVLKQQKSV